MYLSLLEGRTKSLVGTPCPMFLHSGKSPPQNSQCFFFGGGESVGRRSRHSGRSTPALLRMTFFLGGERGEGSFKITNLLFSASHPPWDQHYFFLKDLNQFLLFLMFFSQDRPPRTTAECRGRRGFTRQHESPNVHRAPVFKPTTKIQREDLQEREERKEIVAGEKESAKFWVSHPDRQDGQTPSQP